MAEETRCINRLTPAFTPDCLVLRPRWALGLLPACPVAARIENRGKEPGALTEQRGKDFFPRPSRGLHDASVSDFPVTFGPRDFACVFPCVLGSWCILEFRWGTLKIEQVRAVPTKWEGKLKRFLSLAKDPFSKTPPNADKHGVHSSPFWAIMTSLVMHFHVSLSSLS